MVLLFGGGGGGCKNYVQHWRRADMNLQRSEYIHMVNIIVFGGKWGFVFA